MSRRKPFDLAAKVEQWKLQSPFGLTPEQKRHRAEIRKEAVARLDSEAERLWKSESPENFEMALSARAEIILTEMYHNILDVSVGAGAISIESEMGSDMVWEVAGKGQRRTPSNETLSLHAPRDEFQRRAGSLWPPQQVALREELRQALERERIFLNQKFKREMSRTVSAAPIRAQATVTAGTLSWQELANRFRAVKTACPGLTAGWTAYIEREAYGIWLITPNEDATMEARAEFGLCASIAATKLRLPITPLPTPLEHSPVWKKELEFYAKRTEVTPDSIVPYGLGQVDVDAVDAKTRAWLDLLRREKVGFRIRFHGSTQIEGLSANHQTGLVEDLCGASVTLCLRYAREEFDHPNRTNSAEENVGSSTPQPPDLPVDLPSKTVAESIPNEGDIFESSTGAGAPPEEVLSAQTPECEAQSNPDKGDTLNFSTEAGRRAAIDEYVEHFRSENCTAGWVASAARVHRSDLSKWRYGRLPENSVKSQNIERVLRDRERPPARRLPKTSEN